nr:MAG TPA: hypothetical protein [Caudoviricetes sp.]
MKKCINGEYIEMTPEEIAEFKAMAAEQPVPEPTAEERLVALEEAVLELLGVTK